MRNVTSPDLEPQTIHLSKDIYKDKNCLAANSPVSNVALIIERSGLVKLVNCSTGQNTWKVHDLGRLENRGWQFWALGFSSDGCRALALDRKGKLLIAEFG